MLHEACQTFSREFWVEGYKIETSIQFISGKPISITFAWIPHIPKRINHRFKTLYRKKRDAVLQAVADSMNESIAIADDLDKVPRIKILHPK